MTSASITLKSNYELQADGKHRLQVWVHEASNITPNVFLFDTVPADPDPAIQEGPAIFFRTCIYADLLNYTTRSLDHTPFFRNSYVDTLWDTEDAAAAFFLTLQADVEALIDELGSLSATATTTCTDDLDGGYHLVKSKRISDQGSNEITLQITCDDSGADTAFFVIEPTSDSPITATNQDAELLRIATVDDMYAIPDAQSSGELYRTATIVFAVESEARIETFLQNMVDDITVCVNRVANGPIVGEELVSSGSYTDPVYWTE